MNEPPPIAYERSKRLSTGQKVLIGCGIGCGTIIILGIIIFSLAAWWVFSPGDQVATNRILHSDSMGVVRMENVTENQGAMEFLSHALQEAQRISQDRSSGQLPPFLEKLKNYLGNNK